MPDATPVPRRIVAVFALASGIALATGTGTAAAAPVPVEVPAAPEPPATTSPTPATPASTAPVQAAPQPRTMKQGLDGQDVLDMQHRLMGLGYWIDKADGHYGAQTRQAVMAFQKAEGLSRDGVAGPKTQARLPQAGMPQPQHLDGNLLEVDLKRQLLFVVRDGKVVHVLNTSTGNGERYDRKSGGQGVASTPRGDFTIKRQIDGMRKAELGDLYRPKYFNGGIAVHGSGSVPARPASHGCVRLTNAAMDMLWSTGVAEIGTRVVVV